MEYFDKSEYSFQFFHVSSMYLYAHIIMALAPVVKYWGILKGEMLNSFDECVCFYVLYIIFICVYNIYIYIHTLCKGNNCS